MIREIWQPKHSLQTATGKRALRLLGHNRFRAAYDFLLMRERAGEQLERSAQFWTELQTEHADKIPKPPARRRRPRNTSPRQQRH